MGTARMHPALPIDQRDRRARRRAFRATAGLLAVGALSVWALGHLQLGHGEALLTARPAGARRTGSGFVVHRLAVTAGRVGTVAVRAGDTLDAIAARSGRATAAVRTANPGVVPERLRIGARLRIPVPPVLEVTVVSRAGSARPRVRLGVHAEPGESVVFRVHTPSGASFTGPVHQAGADGRVAAAYAPAPVVAGSYLVAALGDQGTVTWAAFSIAPH